MAELVWVHKRITTEDIIADPVERVERGREMNRQEEGRGGRKEGGKEKGEGEEGRGMRRGEGKMKPEKGRGEGKMRER
jgi:hypothetical protein